jgi:hypothetical protein
MFQDVNFKSVDDFLEYIPEEEHKIVMVLRNLIFGCIPGCTEKLTYNVPFYKRKKNICFIWPASVKWGSKVTYEGVRLGFSKGYLISDPLNYLERGTRKYIYWKTFHDVREINTDIVKTYLFEAASLDV